MKELKEKLLNALQKKNDDGFDSRKEALEILSEPYKNGLSYLGGLIFPDLLDNLTLKAPEPPILWATLELAGNEEKEKRMHAAAVMANDQKTIIQLHGNILSRWSTETKTWLPPSVILSRLNQNEDVKFLVYCTSTPACKRATRVLLDMGVHSSSRVIMLHPDLRLMVYDKSNLMPLDLASLKIDKSVDRSVFDKWLRSCKVGEHSPSIYFSIAYHSISSTDDYLYLACKPTVTGNDIYRSLMAVMELLQPEVISLFTPPERRNIDNFINRYSRLNVHIEREQALSLLREFLRADNIDQAAAPWLYEGCKDDQMHETLKTLGGIDCVKPLTLFGAWLIALAAYRAYFRDEEMGPFIYNDSLMDKDARVTASQKPKLRGETIRALYGLFLSCFKAKYSPTPTSTLEKVELIQNQTSNRKRLKFTLSFATSDTLCDYINDAFRSAAGSSKPAGHDMSLATCKYWMLSSVSDVPLTNTNPSIFRNDIVLNIEADERNNTILLIG